MSWNGSDNEKPLLKTCEKETRRGCGIARPIIIALGLVLIAALAWIYYDANGDSGADSSIRKSRPVDVVSPGSDKTSVTDSDVLVTNHSTRVAAANAVPSVGSLSNASSVAANKPDKKKAPFSTGAEQLMSWIFNARPGRTPPPLLKLSPSDSKNLAAILMSKNPVLEGDSKVTVEGKKMVELAKKEMIQFIKDGGKAEDFLGYYHGELVKAYNERKDAQMIVLESLREDPAVGLELAEEVNKRLAEKGIEPIIIPPKYRK